MIENFLKFPQIREFLTEYSKDKWKTCINSLVLYGLRAVQRDYCSVLTVAELARVSGLEECEGTQTSFRKQELVRYPSKNRYLNTSKETQTTSYNTRTNAYESSVKKNNSCQTVLDSFSKTKNGVQMCFTEPSTDFLDFSEDVVQIKSVKEPRICSIENAQGIFRNSSKDKFGNFKNRVSNKGVPYLPLYSNGDFGFFKDYPLTTRASKRY